MNVTTMEMDPDQAKAKLKEYRRELHHAADATYESIAAGYKAMAQGLRLLDIRQAIDEGGFFDDGWPRLAVARADRREVSCQRSTNRLAFNARRRDERAASLLVELAISTPAQTEWWRRKHTMVPLVPAQVKQQLRQNNRSMKLENYHILWEVEEWYDSRVIEPPIDPFLLKHVGGTLYAVLAEWDLTELERSVLRRV